MDTKRDSDQASSSPPVEALLKRARAGDPQAFGALAAPYRRELLAHCYRILGSVEDGEDAVQETLLAAWRGLERFEGRASPRTWLYRIATNRCLNMMREDRRRPHDTSTMPDPPFDLPRPTVEGESVWVQPYPDAWLESLRDTMPGPAARYEEREAVSLAFVTALQRLPPRQRSVLVLRDVHGFRAVEVADMLATTVDAVESALKRARKTLAEHHPTTDEPPPQPGSPHERAIVGRFADAFLAGDVHAIVALLTEDARYEMPPVPGVYRGRSDIAGLLTGRYSWLGGRGVRLVPTRANAQPAFGCYFQDPRAPMVRAQGLVVLTLAGDKISGISRFVDNSLLPHFGLPRTIRT